MEIEDDGSKKKAVDYGEESGDTSIFPFSAN